MKLFSGSWTGWVGSRVYEGCFQAGGAMMFGEEMDVVGSCWRRCSIDVVRGE